MKWKNNQNGFSLVQVMIAFALLSSASLLIMKFFSKQQTQIKQQSSDISVNYILHNISKVISARSICTYSYKLNDPKMPMQDNYEMNQIAMEVEGQPDFVIAKVETEETAKLTGKFGAWISKMEIVEHNPPIGVDAKIRKARLAIEFQRRIDKDNIKTDKTYLDINLVELTKGVVDSCFGAEDFSAKAFCETALRGTFDMNTQLCRAINISSLETPTPPDDGVYSIKTARDPANPDLRSDIRVEGNALISNWVDKDGKPRVITIANGDITNVRKLVASEEVLASTVTAKRFNHTSDRRLKKNIKTISAQDANAVLKLDGVSFKWKNSEQKALGFIAQDVEKIYPDLVSENKTTHTKTVDYSGILPLILEKMKAQEKEIKDLNKKLSDLKAKKK